MITIKIHLALISSSNICACTLQQFICLHYQWDLFSFVYSVNLYTFCQCRIQVCIIAIQYTFCIILLQTFDDPRNMAHPQSNWPMMLPKGPFTLATVTQIFHFVSMSSEMSCIVTNITVRTWRQKKHIVVVMYEQTLIPVLLRLNWNKEDLSLLHWENFDFLRESFFSV